MQDERFRDHLLRALKIVWIILGFVSGMMIIVPFVLSSQSVFALFPICSAKAAGGSCIFCGMTTAFIRIGSGDFSGAQAANAGSIALFSLLCLNLAGVVAYTMMRAIRHANT